MALFISGTYREPNGPGDPVTRGNTFDEVESVFPVAPGKGRGDTDVHGAVPLVGKDVDAGDFIVLFGEHGTNNRQEMVLNRNVGRAVAPPAHTWVPPRAGRTEKESVRVAYEYGSRSRTWNR